MRFFIICSAWFLIDLEAKRKVTMSARRTLKYLKFVAEPMQGKSVTRVAGIHRVLGGRLRNGGYESAEALLAKFIALDKSQEGFCKWLKNSIGANRCQQAEIYGCLMLYYRRSNPERDSHSDGRSDLR